VIAFGGRILDAEKKDAPKYLNSPDTPLFDKGRTLFNLHRAAPAARKAARMIVVEGYMDVVALSAAGIGECVAPLGTALTERQIELLWRQVETPVLCFDGDAAGQRAAMRAITRALPLLRPGHSLAIMRVPGGLDPDDLVRREGPQAIERLLADAESLLDGLWRFERDSQGLATPEAKAGLKARLIAHTETIADKDIRALYRRDLLDRFSEFAFPRREPRAVASPRKPPRGGFAPAPPSFPLPETARHWERQAASPNGALARAVLAGLARHPEAIRRRAEDLAQLRLPDPALQILLDALLDAAELTDPLENGRLLTTLEARGIAVPTARECGGLAYPFLTSRAPVAVAVGTLDAALTLLVEGPGLAAALEGATARFDIEEQTRLRTRRKELEDRVKAQGRFTDSATEKVGDAA
jgi:DNA primase